MSKRKWKLDPAHSEISFKVELLLISRITGRHNQFDVAVETEHEDVLAASKIAFSADVNSIETNNEARDTDLKSEEFFHRENHSKILFSADEYSTVGSEARLNGLRTIKDIEQPVRVNVAFGGWVEDIYGQIKAGISVSGRISRTKFGLTSSMATTAGVAVTGDEIRFRGEIQLINQA